MVKVKGPKETRKAIKSRHDSRADEQKSHNSVMAPYPMRAKALLPGRRKVSDFHEMLAEFPYGVINQSQARPATQQQSSSPAAVQHGLLRYGHVRFDHVYGVLLPK